MSGDIESLKDYIASCGNALVAFSGGVDSSVVLKLSVLVLGSDNVLAATGVSRVYPEREVEAAGSFAESLGVRHLVFETDEFSIPEFVSNCRTRCYHCKKHFYSKLNDFATGNGIRHVFDGSNADDTRDFRPGREAAKELGVESPLEKFAFSKRDIRNLAKDLGIGLWNKPSSPCLASRVPYGERITKKKLRMIEKAEEILRARGFSNVRVRCHGKLAKIEVPKSEMPRFFDDSILRLIARDIRDAGFVWVSLDLDGFRSGAMNEEFIKAIVSKE